MKRVLFILMMMISGISLSQTSTTNPDTVCYQSTTLSTYTVPSIGSGTYTWTVTSPGVITAGQGTNSISVNWSASTGEVWEICFHESDSYQKISTRFRVKTCQILDAW
jgi:hypothetical protein